MLPAGEYEPPTTNDTGSGVQGFLSVFTLWTVAFGNKKLASAKLRFNHLNPHR